MKSREEVIARAIISGGTQQQKRSATAYLRSVAAKAESDLVHISRLAQSEAIDAIESIKPKDLEQYRTKKLTDLVSSIFGRMVADCEVIARRMIVANTLAGKISAVMNLRLKGDELVQRISLTKDDESRINKAVADVVDKFKRGVSFAMASVNNTVQNLALHVNMKRPDVIPGDKKKDITVKDTKVKQQVKQETISSSFSGEHVQQKRAQRIYTEKLPTKAEIDNILKSPVVYANMLSKQNIKYVADLHRAYIHGADIQSSKPIVSSKNKTDVNPANEAISSLSANLRKNGLFAFVDKGNKRWTLEGYCAMTARTAATQSSNSGDLFADSEHDLYYIVPHAGACPICSKYQGKVYSRSGKDPHYPPLASVFSKIDPNGTNDLDNTYLTIHPNCRHKIIKYVEPKKK